MQNVGSAQTSRLGILTFDAPQGRCVSAAVGDAELRAKAGAPGLGHSEPELSRFA